MHSLALGGRGGSKAESEFLGTVPAPVRKRQRNMAALGVAMRKLIHIAYKDLKAQTEYRPQTA